MEFFAQTKGMLIVFVRTAIIFATLLIIMRLMGKRQIGEMQPFEFIITLIIADLACIPMSDVSIPLLYGIVAILALFILHQLLAILQKNSVIFRRIISGKPSIVINKKGIDFTELKRNDLDVGDLIESMRALGYFSLDDVIYAVFESNGKLSAMPNQEKSSTPQEQQSQSLPIILVEDGKANYKNLTLIESSLAYIKQTLNIKSLKKVGVITVDGNGRVYFQNKGESYKITNITLNKGVKW